MRPTRGRAGSKQEQGLTPLQADESPPTGARGPSEDGAPPRRRAVLVTNGLVIGGAETQTVRLAEALTRSGYEVGLLSILPTAAFHEELRALNIPVAHVRVHSALRSLSSIRDGVLVLRAWRPDVVISFVYQANILARVAGWLTGVPVIISSIRNERFGGSQRELLMRLTERLCTVTTTNSHRAARFLVERHVVSQKRLVVIPNGLDPGPFGATPDEREKLRRDLGVGDDEFLWFAAGRLEPQKDYVSLLFAFAELARAGASARLFIAGQGPDRDDLESVVRRLDLVSRVTLLGLRKDVPSLLAACDSLVLSSAWEGLPNIVMEAMASSRPVVGTHVGGVPELVEHARSGFLVQPGTPADLAAAMKAVMDLSPSERRAMGERGERVVAAFSPDEVARRWLTLIDDCVRDRGLNRAPRAPLSVPAPDSSEAIAPGGAR